MSFISKRLSSSPDTVAPDGSDVRLLLELAGGSMAHFSLAPGQVSSAVVHRTVDEIWYVLTGRGEMWMSSGELEEVLTLEAGLCLAIPHGTRFQFRCLSRESLTAVAVTMPPWPGSEEARLLEGKWVATVPSS